MLSCVTGQPISSPCGHYCNQFELHSGTSSHVFGFLCVPQCYAPTHHHVLGYELVLQGREMYFKCGFIPGFLMFYLIIPHVLLALGNKMSTTTLVFLS